MANKKTRRGHKKIAFFEWKSNVRIGKKNVCRWCKTPGPVSRNDRCKDCESHINSFTHRNEYNEFREKHRFGVAVDLSKFRSTYRRD
jgi:hypothetical protein